VYVYIYKIFTHVEAPSIGLSVVKLTGYNPKLIKYV